MQPGRQSHWHGRKAPASEGSRYKGKRAAQSRPYREILAQKEYSAGLVLRNFSLV
jgi:hypothetical protein